ncbi:MULTISPECIES: exonuclease SbcCD subunit D [Haloferax]|uniref:Metallophosphoesterase n=2 Tax=Haloferax TaxID=2251 RepID=A0A6G1Z6Z7_9EURY|nr:MULTISPECIES: metallophosphoesterase [Haloferax]KAB1184775.1 metallophosphoesterase [Haloferax sp. CBA1149]MRW82407.1 metallophosphoesterase [Haloferax marinisediminis]
MKIGHLADIHLGHRQYGLKQREDDMTNTFKATLQLIMRDDPDAILLPGDLFHSRDLRPKALEAAEKGLSVVPNDVPVLVSRGNHDENLTPREVTWLNYLHRRGHIVLLEADLENNPEVAQFGRYDADEPGEDAGFYDIETDTGTVRVFGLQWRGARTDTALEKVAKGIRETAEDHGQPDYTVLLAHFGIEDEVPALGGNVTHAELRDVREVVDYLALGHIHKCYDASGWIYNPGSSEAHSTSEARDDWNHGYYSVDLSPADDEYDGPGQLAHDVNHKHSRRRPFYTIKFDVTPYESVGELETAFREQLSDEQSVLQNYLDREEFLLGNERREPMIDLRFEGTLQFDRGSFRVDELADQTATVCDALYVQTNTSRVTTAEIQELLAELDDEEVFVDGRLQTAALEQRVFETIATESEYSNHADAVAALLGDAHRMAQDGESTDDIVDVVSESRRELFPEATSGVSLDVSEDPFAERDEGEESTAKQQTAAAPRGDAN